VQCDVGFVVQRKRSQERLTVVRALTPSDWRETPSGWRQPRLLGTLSQNTQNLRYTDAAIIILRSVCLPDYMCTCACITSHLCIIDLAIT